MGSQALPAHRHTRLTLAPPGDFTQLWPHVSLDCHPKRTQHVAFHVWEAAPDGTKGVKR
jgi:hypothetical protein